MTNAAISIVFWGIYALLTGLALLFLPNTILQFMGFDATLEHWILVVALLMVGLGFYYIVLGVTEVTQFFLISSIGRLSFFIASIILIAINKAPLSILLFGVIDLITAVWTLVALHVDKTASSS